MVCSVIETGRAILIVGPGQQHFADVTRFYGDHRDRQRADMMAAAASLHDALENLCKVIRAAGVHNLANGVQLGQVAWAIKAEDALAYADRIIAVAGPTPSEDA